MRAARREELVSFAMGSRFVSRLRFLATISLANVVVVYTTVFSDWTLKEAALAYAGEWLILMLVVYARVLIAKRLPGEGDSGGRRWPLLYAKAMAILVTLLMNGLFIGLMTLLLLGGFDFSLLPDSTWRALGWCWLAFLIAHAIGFVEFARQGAYDELIDDNRVMANLWRYPAMLPAAVAVAGERSHDAPVVPWFFVTALVLMAVVDVGIYVAEMDAMDAGRRKARELQAGSV